jgi:4-hydroxybutyryl-CoA dehydratase/vinylacetyl-CoA-Delta-isomerase
MTAEGYRASLRELHPDVWVRGRRVPSVADEPLLAPGVNALALTYEMALRPELADTMLVELPGGGLANRMNALDTSADDLLRKLEACRLLCRATGCAQRYLTHDALGALAEITSLADASLGTEYAGRLAVFAERAAERDLACAVAMTDARGDRSRRPHQQADPDQYLRVVERRPDGAVLRGAKVNITGAPYCHEVIVLPTRAMTAEDGDYAVACVVPIDAPGLRVISRPAGRAGVRAAPFSAQYGQATAMLVFDDVVVPWDRVLLCGEFSLAGRLAEAYANHHRHSCIGCRAALGDIVIGAAVEMAVANGLSVERGHLRGCLAQLISIVEGFYACGIAASVRGRRTAGGCFVPDGVYSNIGKLMLAEQVPVMFRVAQEMAGGVVATVPTPEDVEAGGELVRRYLDGAVVGGAEHRVNVARLMADLTASDEGGWYALISLHGGGSPEALRASAVRQYDVEGRRELARRLACLGGGEGGCSGCGSCG